eukprot:6176692-Pleurochrysis_carterae.AAC.1
MLRVVTGAFAQPEAFGIFISSSKGMFYVPRCCACGRHTNRYLAVDIHAQFAGGPWAHPVGPKLGS